MKDERGHFAWEGDKVVWVASEKGPYIINPTTGLRLSTDPDIIVGKSLLEELDRETIKRVKKYCNEK